MQENDDDGGVGPTPPIPPVNPSSGGGGGGGDPSPENILKNHSDKTWNELTQQEQDALLAYGCGTSCWAENQSGGFHNADALHDPAVYISAAFGGWASGLFETSFWGAAAACISNVVCRWATGMAGGAGAELAQTCGTCGTTRPDLVRSPGALQIDADGASVYCRTCVANGVTPLNPNGKFWIHSFNEFEQQANNLHVSPPSFTPQHGVGDGAGHFSAFAGAVGQAWEILNTWIRSSGKTIP